MSHHRGQEVMLPPEAAGGMGICRLLHAFFIIAAVTLDASGVEGLRKDMGDHPSTVLETSQGRRGVVGWYENVHRGKLVTATIDIVRKNLRCVEVHLDEVWMEDIDTVSLVFFDGDSISEGGYCTLGPPTPLGVPSEIRGILATTGVSAERYDMGACGICLNVTLSNGDSVLAYVNDECKSCDRNDLNLGIVGTNDENATWIAVPCDVTTPVKYLFQASNEYYLKVQPRLTRCPVQSMRVKSLSGWLTGKRTIDNFFQFDGHFEFPLPIELVSDFQETVLDQLQSITYFPRAGLQMAQFLSCTATDNTRSPSSSSPSATRPQGEGEGHENGNTTSATAQSTTPSTARGDEASTSSSSSAAAAAHGNNSLSARRESHSKAPSTPTGIEDGASEARGSSRRHAGAHLRR